MNKRLILLFLSFIIYTAHVYSCTMFRLTINGKTLIGNNEDFRLPGTCMWTLPADSGQYGVLCFGFFRNSFPQGGMNEKGLVFDGFSVSELPVRNTQGKKSIQSVALIEGIMKSCATVEEVEAYILEYDLSMLSRSQLMFADANGHSIIVEGDDILRSTSTYQIATNFYQSRINDKSEITCRRYKAADRLLSGSPELTVAFCTEVLDSVHAEGHWGGTQYSNVYDPANGLITLYLFHNFNELVEIDIKEELAKGEHVTTLEDLFIQKERYSAYKTNYYQAEEGVTRLMGERDMDEFGKIADQLSRNEQTKMFYSQLARRAEFLLSKEKYPRAIGLFSLLKDLYPDSWQGWMKLGDACAQSGDRSEAIACYKKAVELNPQKDELKAKLKEIEAQ